MVNGEWVMVNGVSRSEGMSLMVERPSRMASTLLGSMPMPMTRRPLSAKATASGRPT
jgi:hypothetical protein